MRGGGRDRDTVGAGGFLGEPGDEAGRVGDLASRLANRLAILETEDDGDFGRDVSSRSHDPANRGRRGYEGECIKASGSTHCLQRSR